MSEPILLSFSSVSTYQRCPRKFELEKFRLPLSARPDNIDTMFGKVVGMGLAYALEHSSPTAGVVWMSAHWDSWILPTANKHYLAAVRAIDLIYRHIHENYEFVLGTTEYPLGLRVNERVYYRGFLDFILRRKSDGRLVVTDLKTTGYKNPDEALYAPNEQVGLYATLAHHYFTPGANHNQLPDGMYLVFSVQDESVHEFPIDTSPDNLLEHLWMIADASEQIQNYVDGDYYFPRRGSGCFAFNRRCPWYGQCTQLRDEYGIKSSEPEEHIEFLDWRTIVDEIDGANND